jgi:hypothetical protein
MNCRTSCVTAPLLISRALQEEEENSISGTIAICPISLFVKATSARNSRMRILILRLIPHLRVSYRDQVVWRIPKGLMKRVSQSRFQDAMLLGLGFVNRNPGRYERPYDAYIMYYLLIDLHNQLAFLKAPAIDNGDCQA